MTKLRRLSFQSFISLALTVCIVFSISGNFYYSICKNIDSEMTADQTDGEMTEKEGLKNYYSPITESILCCNLPVENKIWPVSEFKIIHFHPEHSVPPPERN